MNAIMDALWPLGVRNIQMPATPQRVWQAIQERAQMSEQDDEAAHLRLDLDAHRHRHGAGHGRGRRRSPGCTSRTATTRRPAELFERTQNTYVRDLTKGTACRYVDTLYPHPYLAFVHHGNPPCGLPNVNNIGLFGADFPIVKRDRPLRRPADRRLGRLAAGAELATPPAPRYLEEELNKHYVSPNGKPWLVLNGGDGAWKEPQPFILFSLYATLGRRGGHARRLQRALFLLARHRGAAGERRSATSSRSIRSSPTRISATPRSAG